MPFLNVGALTRAGERIPTKRALKDAVKEDPSNVLFDPTSVFDKGGVLCADNLPHDVILNVCGPDPHRSRRWFASVSWTEKGPQVL